VWYKFKVTSSTSSITISSGGGNLTPASTYLEVLNGTCTSFTSIACQTINTTPLVLNNLIVGTTYYVRIYTTTGINGNAGFTICLEDSPNDECSNSVNLISNTSCITPAISGTLKLAS